MKSCLQVGTCIHRVPLNTTDFVPDCIHHLAGWLQFMGVWKSWMMRLFAGLASSALEVGGDEDECQMCLLDKHEVGQNITRCNLLRNRYTMRPKKI